MSVQPEFPTRPTKGDGSLVVDLGTKRKRKLEDAATRLSRRLNRRVFQSDITRAALDEWMERNR